MITFYLTLYLAIGLLIALTEHRGCRGFVVTGSKRALAIVIAVAAFVDFSEERAA